ncbi:carboxymuconolactone decarboxylase family protein [Candidatus Neomarinimicrobiota bacterium]
MPKADQQKLLSAITTDYTRSDISAADKAMLNYAKKLTLEPTNMTADDVDELRAHGFDDLAIHDICAITAYFNFVNRMADGLGVELEDHMVG